MKIPHRAAAGSVLAALTLNLAAAPAPPGSMVIAAAYGRNETLRTYTFHMSVAMAMKHFPWLHFSMNGDGVYQRDQRYVVHFTSGPPFASKPPDVDLSLIDPTMWPGRYQYAETGEQNGDTIFSLESLDDPSLKSATVAMSPTDGAKWVDATYADGMHVHMIVNSNSQFGYLLPSTMQAEVDYPHMPLSAKVQFSGYALAR